MTLREQAGEINAKKDETCMRFTILPALILALAACAPATPDDRVTSEDRALPGPSEEIDGGGLADIELCDAEDYRPLVGSSVDATTFPAGPRLRVFGINDIVTQDYIPQRTNVVYDTSRRIVRVYCG